MKKTIITNATQLASLFYKNKVNITNKRYCIQLSDNSEIIIKKVLRSYVDIKRKTFLVKWHSELVVAKCFYGSQFHKINPEIHNQLLISDTVNTPKVLKLLTDVSGTINIALFEYIESTVGIYRMFKNSNLSKSYLIYLNIIEQLYGLLEKGYIKDTVPSNFIIRNNEVFLIDFSPLKKVRKINILSIIRSVRGFIAALLKDNTKSHVLIKTAYLYLMKKNARNTHPVTYLIFVCLIRLEYFTDEYIFYKLKSMRRALSIKMRELVRWPAFRNSQNQR